MCEKINPIDIYNKNINILLGSGASADLFPTLYLKIKDSDGSQETIETLANKFNDCREIFTTLFMHYYQTCIYPVQSFDFSGKHSDSEDKNLQNYKNFLHTLLSLLDRSKELYRKINIFTTNYDGCLSHVADTMLFKDVHEFVINDGTAGFHKKILHPRNFNTFQSQIGIFERSNYGIPQLNIIHLHGSVYWSKVEDKIEVNYTKRFENFLDNSIQNKLEAFSDYLANENNKSENIFAIDLNNEEINKFWENYNQLPIVNPTKWKFYETVFDEHYYQMLRFLSYELEKPNSILITFGFSFADEHILKLIQRSLSNPQLQTFICCYSSKSRNNMEEAFKLWRNVNVIGPNNDINKLDFSKFNESVLSISSKGMNNSENLVGSNVMKTQNNE